MTPSRDRAAEHRRPDHDLAASEHRLHRARRDDDAVGDRLGYARTVLATARRATAQVSAVTPNATGWLALAEAEHERARGAAQPGRWSDAADTWQRLERPPLAAYCR
jgi:hypothetical protein